MSQTRLGIDIGGTGIKCGLVDLGSGALVSERMKRKTPRPATPQAVGEVVALSVKDFEYDGPIGIGFPAVIHDNVVKTAMNIDPSWIGRNVVEVLGEATGCDVTVLNDADAAALAEFQYGAAQDVHGLVVTITFGTGIGSGLIVDGQLVANVELGGIELDGHCPAEKHFSAKAREVEGLSWEEWGRRANRYLSHINGFLNPELIVVGGGVAKRWERFAGEMDPDLPLKVAAIGNAAGIVGAALLTTR